MAKKVLVIDDDADILELLIYNLEKEGYEVKSASNGLEGIEAAKNFMPDLILMDIMMPIMDGIEAGKIIKNTEKLKHIHLLYLTARAEEYSEVAAFEVGADDYLTKPIKPRALLSRINAFFRKETQKNADEGILQIAGLTINKETYSVTKEDGSVVVLPKKSSKFCIIWPKCLTKFNQEKVYFRKSGVRIFSWWSVQLTCTFAK